MIVEVSVNIVKMQVSQYGIEGCVIDRILLNLAHAVLDYDEYSATIYSGSTHTLWLKMDWADIIAFFLLAESVIRQSHRNMHDALAALRRLAGMYTESEIRDVMQGLLEAARLQGEYSEEMWTFARAHPWTIRFLRVHDDQSDLLRRMAFTQDVAFEVSRDPERQEKDSRPAQILIGRMSSQNLNQTLRFRFESIGGGYYTYLRG